LLAAVAPKGQKLLAQGSALGPLQARFVRPERAKALIEFYVLELLPFQGERTRRVGQT
jgi:hypothetical protein